MLPLALHSCTRAPSSSSRSGCSCAPSLTFCQITHTGPRQPHPLMTCSQPTCGCVFCRSCPTVSNLCSNCSSVLSSAPHAAPISMTTHCPPQLSESRLQAPKSQTHILTSFAELQPFCGSEFDDTLWMSHAAKCTLA